MFRTRTMTAGILLAACLVCFFPTLSASEVVTVYRDTWGVPHVYAETEAGAAYGLGYAQAGDRLVQLLRNIREAEGTMAEAFGPDWIKHDYERRIEQHRKVCRAEYENVAPEIRRYLEAFQEGVTQYMREHPERVPKQKWVEKRRPKRQSQ